MRININLPWNRYGLIAELASRLKDKSPQFGKTVLQKMVYLLQELYKVDCDYSYNLYTYGPFSSQLLQDLDLVESFDGVEICPVVSGLGGFHILLGQRNEAVREKAKEFLSRQDVKESICRLIKDFGHYSAKDLELRSTIVYVYHDMKSSTGNVAEKDLESLVKQIKPKFSLGEISSSIKELENKGFLAF